jgi:hypothetical protein
VPGSGDSAGLSPPSLCDGVVEAVSTEISGLQLGTGGRRRVVWGGGGHFS